MLKWSNCVTLECQPLIFLDLTMCPGHDVYMPPEALPDIDLHKYTEKFDCFSFGVVVIQVLTREFPIRSGDRRKYSY